jgi:adenylyltransferase/sulfurtransferase
VIQYLAAAGVGHLTLCDDDVVERSNLNRQVLHTDADIGSPKVRSAARFVQALDPYLHVDARQSRVSVNNVRSLLQTHDLAVDCTDGLPVKFLLNDAAVAENVPLVHGAASAFAGQALFIPGRAGPCLRCLFEDMPPPGAVPGCQVTGVLGATVALVGSLMVNLALHALARRPGPEPGRFLVVDALGTSVRPVRMTPRQDCGACGVSPVFDATVAEDYAPRRERP